MPAETVSESHRRRIRAYCNKYEKTKKGFLMRAYRNMKSRVTGVQKDKAHLYEGRELLPKADFYEWALADPEFHRLFDAWESSGYERPLTPSVDRKDSGAGYIFWNMEWVTHSENSRRGAVNIAEQRNARVTEDQVRRIRREFANGVKQVPLAAKHGLSLTCVHNIVRRKSWANI